MVPRSTIRIGVSGWRYAPWRGTFYPKDLPQRAELDYAAHCFPSVEINGSFYSLQSPRSWRAWYEATPEDFMFAVKGPRYITHMLRLKNIEKPLANFFASGLFRLGEKLGPILWQFPPNFTFEPERFVGFLGLLPRDLEEAAALARGREAFMRGRVALSIGANQVLRHAVEVRHESFIDPRFVRLRRNHNVALVIAETARRWPMLQDVTADFVYLRLHGDKKLYRSGYGDKALARWADRIIALSGGVEPTDATKADPRSKPVDAKTLMDKLGVRWPAKSIACPAAAA